MVAALDDRHPLLRRKFRGRLGDPKQWWVVVGRSREDPDDEVWTQSRRFLRAVRALLSEDGSWCDAYLSKGGLGYEKPFVHRNIGERELNDVIVRGGREPRFVLTLQPNDGCNGIITERVFDLLVAEGVLRNPTVREFRPVHSISTTSKSAVTMKTVTRDRVWAVDQQAADDWLATRLLLLEDSGP